MRVVIITQRIATRKSRIKQKNKTNEQEKTTSTTEKGIIIPCFSLQLTSSA